MTTDQATAILDGVKVTCTLTLRLIMTAQAACEHMSKENVLPEEVKRRMREAANAFEELETEAMGKINVQ